MLHEFLTMYREAIIARTRAKLVARPWPSATAHELEHGVPLFLSQLSETLRGEQSETPFAANAIAASAARSKPSGRCVRQGLIWTRQDGSTIRTFQVQPPNVRRRRRRSQVWRRRAETP